MTSPALDRRMLLGGAALAASAVTASAVAQTAAPAPAASGFAPKPLPFDPKAVPGLSEKLLTSHHDNNYVGAVTRLGAIRGEFAKLDPAKAPGSPGTP
jgi:Fe-Mn family superoxide dismutase